MLLLQICWKWSNSAGILGQVTARGQLSLSQAIYGNTAEGFGGGQLVSV